MNSALEIEHAARAGDRKAFDALAATHRRALRAHCYRLCGSLHEAEDLLQLTLLKAWSGITSFQGRSSLKTWLYRVATNVCLDAASSSAGRAFPTGLGAPNASAAMAPRPDLAWLEPCPEEWIVDEARSPEARYSARESVSIAFLAALQLLPAKQRAVLLLHDVLGWSAAECAEVLALTVAAVNSALQRARASLDRARADAAGVGEIDDDTRTLLARYVQAWEGADVEGLVKLLRDDAVLAMPPFEAWFQGAHVIGAAVGPMVMPPGSAGTFKLRATTANGLPAFAAWARDPSGTYRAAALHVLEVRGGAIAGISAFLDPRLFEAFGLPMELAADAQ